MKHTIRCCVRDPRRPWWTQEIVLVPFGICQRLVQPSFVAGTRDACPYHYWMCFRRFMRGSAFRLGRTAVAGRPPSYQGFWPVMDAAFRRATASRKTTPFDVKDHFHLQRNVTIILQLRLPAQAKVSLQTPCGWPAEFMQTFQKTPCQPAC